MAPEHVTSVLTPRRVILVSVVWIYLSLTVCDKIVLQKLNAPTPLDWAKYLGIFPTLRNFTICYSIKPFFLQRVMTVFSYAIENSDNELKIEYIGRNWNMRIFNSEIYSNMKYDLVPLRWHNFCLSVHSTLFSGSDEVSLAYTMVKDGKVASSGETNMTTKEKCIRKGGVLILGQDQDKLGGGFQEEQSFGGEVFRLLIWDKAYEENVLRGISIFEQKPTSDPIIWFQKTEWKLNGSSFWSPMKYHELKHELTVGRLYLFPFRLSFEEHTSFCESLGSELGVPLNSEENRHMLSDSKPWFRVCTNNNTQSTFSWLGIRDSNHEGKWITKTGYEPTYFGWDRNEPNGHKQENCAASVELRGTNVWFDLHCDSSKNCGTCRLTQPPIIKLRGPIMKIYDTDSYFVLSLPIKVHIELIGFYNTVISFENSSYIIRHENQAISTLEVKSGFINPIGRKKWLKFFTKDNEPKETTLLLSVCGEDEFSCSDGKCVPILDRCNSFPQCDDGTDEENCSIVIIPVTYNPAIVPPSLPLSEPEEIYVQRKNLYENRDYTPLLIYIEFDIRRIASINVMQMEITLEFLLTARWRDTRLTFHNLKHKMERNLVNRQFFKSIWTPEIDFVNGRGNSHTTLDDNSDILIDRQTDGELTKDIFSYEDLQFPGDKNIIHMSRKYNVTFTCPLDLTSYPFDKQICEIVLQMTSALDDHLMMKVAEKGIKLTAKSKLVEYEILNVYEFEKEQTKAYCHGNDTMDPSLSSCVLKENFKNQTSEDSKSSYSRIVIVMEMRRLFQFYLFSTFIPTSLMVFIAYITLYFAMDDFNDRIMVSLTALLVLTSLFNQSSTSLPKTSYLKYVDIWFLSSTVFIFIVIVIQTILDALRTEKSKPDKHQDPQDIRNKIIKRKFNNWTSTEKIIRWPNKNVSPRKMIGHKWRIFSRWSKIVLFIFFTLFIFFYWMFALKSYYNF